MTTQPIQDEVLEYARNHAPGTIRCWVKTGRASEGDDNWGMIQVASTNHAGERDSHAQIVATPEALKQVLSLLKTAPSCPRGANIPPNAQLYARRDVFGNTRHNAHRFMGVKVSELDPETGEITDQLYTAIVQTTALRMLQEGKLRFVRQTVGPTGATTLFERMGRLLNESAPAATVTSEGEELLGLPV